jgi:hypothetical protein
VEKDRVPFAANLRDDDWRVGPTFFDEHFGEGHRPATTKALVPDFDAIVDAHFDPSRVHPTICDFYRDSASFNIVLERVEWRSPFDRVAPLYAPLASRVFKQLAVPASSTQPRAMRSRLGDLDVDQDGTPDYRTWVRYFPAEDGTIGSIFYVAALQVLRVTEAGAPRSFLSVCLPLHRGNKTSVFAFENLPRGGLLLTTTSRRSTLAGSYLVFCDVPRPGYVSYLPALGLGETLRFWVDPRASDAGIQGEHLEYWRGREVFRLQYRIVRGAGRQIRLERAVDGLSSAEQA